MAFWSDLLAFLSAVLNNWAGYVTGGIIVALAWFWSTWFNQPVSRRVGLAIAFVFLLLAIFNAWREERSAKVALEARLAADRAHWELDFSGIEKVHLDSTAQPYNPASVMGSPFLIRVALKNHGKHYAAKVRARLAVTPKDLTVEPWINVAVDNGDNETRLNAIKAPITIGGDVKPCFIVYQVTYEDAQTHSPYVQSWYWAWEGSKGGFFNGDFGNASSVETARIVPYLRSHGWQIP
jgi:hypothetical protein